MPKKRKKTPTDQTDRLARAIGHPLRRMILEALAREPGSATTISQRFDEPLATVSYHLNQVLDQECKVVDVVMTRSNRGGRERFYAMQDTAFLDVISWPAIPRSVRLGLWGTSLKSFLAIAISALKADAFGGSSGPSMLVWRSALVDDHGQAEISEAMGDVAQRIEEAKRNSVTRCNGGDAEPPRQLIVGLAAFRPAEAVADGGESGWGK